MDCAVGEIRSRLPCGWLKLVEKFDKGASRRSRSPEPVRSALDGLAPPFSAEGDGEKGLGLH